MGDEKGGRKTLTNRHKQTQTDRHRHRHRQTDTQTQTYRFRHTDTERQTQRDRHTDRQTQTDRHRHTDTGIHTQTDRRRHRQTDRHRWTDTDRQKQTIFIFSSHKLSARIWIVFKYGLNGLNLSGALYSGWSTIYKANNCKSKKEHVSRLRDHMDTFEVMDELTMDGAFFYKSVETQEILGRFGIRHRVWSTYNPQSNQLAEGAVKADKRMLRDNTGAQGTLDTDKFIAALLAQRNKPDQRPPCPAAATWYLAGGSRTSCQSIPAS